jgi:ribosomal protein S1
MINQIGNEELAYLFEDNTFSPKNKNRKINKTLSDLYDSVEINIPKGGTIVQSTYVGRTNDQFLFEISGYKDFIRIDIRGNEEKYLKNAEIGDVIDVFILKVDNNNYMIKGSIATIYETRAHQNLKALEEGEFVNVTIKSTNPAGYDVEIHHGGVILPGFMPNTLAGINKLFDPNSIVGDNFDVSIESYAEQEGTYIVSRRKFLQTLIPNAIGELNQQDVYTGHVTGTAPFGVFVEFNECLTGMIHKANVHPDWQDKLGDIKPGFQIDFYVKEIVKDQKGDSRKDKIILTQILRETLWDTIKNGQTLNGVIRDTKQFGTLVNLDDETVGLIHISELDKIGKKFTPEQEVKVKVLSVDRSNRKIFLTVE